MQLKIIPNHGKTKYILSSNNNIDYLQGSKPIIDNFIKDLNKNRTTNIIKTIIGYLTFFIGIGLIVMFVMMDLAYLIWIGIILTCFSCSCCEKTNPVLTNRRTLATYKIKLNNFYNINVKTIPGAKNKNNWYGTNYELIRKNIPNVNVNANRNRINTRAVSRLRNVENNPDANFNFNQFVNRNIPRLSDNRRPGLNNNYQGNNVLLNYQNNNNQHNNMLMRNPNINYQINRIDMIQHNSNNNGQINDLPLNSGILNQNRNNHQNLIKNDEIPIVTYNIKKQIENYPDEEDNKKI